ncbi:MAG TPA: hypothetical protein VM662_06155 [Sphingomonas sp.]|nr:hypothetical protein [Sphingomonas sp.]
MASISVLDFIPAALVPDIRSGTSTVDVSIYFQQAAVAANNNQTNGAGPGGTVFVPTGLYRVDQVGIRDTVFVGEGNGTIIRALTAGSDEQFMFDAMLDRDGTTPNTAGGGWCRNMVIDANGLGRSCLRTYGGGVDAHDLKLLKGGYGLSAGLPIWARFSNIYANACGTGFHTFHAVPGDTGTSTLFSSCWADSCTEYGFQILQLTYSNFVNCVAQNSGQVNFRIGDPDTNGVVVHSLQFIGCATEGPGVPFELHRARNFSLISPRIIMPASTIVDLVLLDDAQGTIAEYSTPGVAPGQRHLNVVNHAAGQASILVLNSAITYAPGIEPYLTIVGPTSRFKDLMTDGIRWHGPLPAEEFSSAVAPIDGYTGLTLTSDGQRVAAFRRIGTPIFRTNGSIIDPSNSLTPGEVSFWIAGTTLSFAGKDENNVLRTFELTAIP